MTMTTSLTRIQIYVLTTLLLGLGVMGYAGYRIAADLQREKTGYAAAHIADRVNSLIGRQQNAMEKIAARPDVAGALRRGRPQDLGRDAPELGALLPHALAARLLPVAGADGAGLDPACRNFVQHALAAENRTSAPEFHAAGALPEHYDLLHPVRDENGKPIGYVLGSFARKPLQELIERGLGNPREYLELQQANADETILAIATTGDRAAADTVEAVAVALADSRWTLLYWPRVTMPPFFAGARTFHFLLIVAAAAAMLALSMLLHVRARRAVRHDIVSLGRIFNDVRAGSVRVDYPMELRDFSSVFQYLRESGRRLAEEKTKLKDMGLIDHLSQLSNRRHFEMRLKELYDLARTHGPSSVLIMDVDHFKKVNDNHGHDAGDALITGFAAALRKTVRQSDVLARLGGDEFCIIYTYVPLEKAIALAERLRKQLPREIPLTKGIMHNVRWTGGLSTIGERDKKFDDVLWRADQAMIKAKEAGRNNTMSFDPANSQMPQKEIMRS